MVEFPLKTKVGDLTISTVDLERVNFDQAPFTVQLVEGYITTKRFETAIVFSDCTLVIRETDFPQVAKKHHNTTVERIKTNVSKEIFRKEHEELRDARFGR